MSSDDRRLEVWYRVLLRLYPREYRQRRGEELVTTLLDASPPNATRPSARSVFDLLRAACLARLKLATGGNVGRMVADGARWAGLFFCAYAVLRNLYEVWWLARCLAAGFPVDGLLTLSTGLEPAAFCLAFIALWQRWRVGALASATLLVALGALRALSYPGPDNWGFVLRMALPQTLPLFAAALLETRSAPRAKPERIAHLVAVVGLLAVVKTFAGHDTHGVALVAGSVALVALGLFDPRFLAALIVLRSNTDGRMLIGALERPWDVRDLLAAMIPPLFFVALTSIQCARARERMLRT
ncbi:MAG: hypothetical protein HOW73_06885 [Polyangiaceae bacterium]|nr:hypothetical protein [Polyangiaceae bacterium]